MAHELIESCDVDDGSLSGLTEQRCFILGAEWETFRQKLRNLEPFSEDVHSENVDRLVRMAERNKRFVETAPLQAGWSRIIVGSQR